MANTNFTDAQLMEEVEVEPGLLVPRAFAIHWNEIRYPKTPYISIEAKLFQTPGMGQSGFGIHPILPLDYPYPKDWLGHPLYPLAQFNCKDLPSLDGIPDSGYLQFYISGSDGLYGLDNENPLSQAGSRVIYFTENEVVRHQIDFLWLKTWIKRSS
jgi:uncharacterized protein YwqG